MEAVRIDKWLWAVRLFKTRSMATESCRAGHVKIRGEVVKPSREAHGGEILTIRMEDITRTVKVLGLLEKRVSAKLAPQYAEDQTPAEEYLKRLENRQKNAIGAREKGSGRPTKKERRQLDHLM